MSDLETVESAPVETPADAVLTQTEPEAQKPEAGAEDGKKEPVEPRVYSEEEHRQALERATAKAAAKAERRAYREALQVKGEPQHAQQQPSRPPAQQQGESLEAYVDRMTDWKIDQREQKSAVQAQQTEQAKQQAKVEKIYTEAEKITGFDRDDFNDVLTSHSFTPEFAQALIESDQAPKLMHYLATNPEDAARIGTLKPARQAAELGRLEDRLAAAPAASKAPAPITPIGQKGSNPIDPEKMTMAQYEKWRESQGAKTRSGLVR